MIKAWAALPCSDLLFQYSVAFVYCSLSTGVCTGALNARGLPYCQLDGVVQQLQMEPIASTKC